MTNAMQEKKERKEGIKNCNIRLGGRHIPSNVLDKLH